ncbi:NADH-dependent [FeFe] hydrogenase, group A6 [Candidatus Stoquefichus sp. SB1]|jgi:NADP-reducing hydrogenase subunit HndD|uniref:NADH-dependent [FeFe] hydrogenase, group A6 n=1 Tax=Candidatus Stoquefichus sp. SB1 TaxID=1658109 RepID=UPI00067F382D|nr:NADH-dependent [FeFe] hydrogenase, group A6 [Candidatus Stoquefichus sp. SB1]
MGKIKLTINNRQVEAYEGKTILEVARENGIHIPTLCYLKDYTGTGACRVCQVEVEGVKNLCAACVYPVRDGMVIKTNSMRALDARRRVVELIVSNHSKDCLSCIRNTNCELQRLCQELGVREDAFKGAKTNPTFDEVSPGVVRNTSKCILCGRCIAACKKHQELGVLGFMERGFKTKVGPVFDRSLNDVNCMQCGQCINVCPVGALQEKEEIHNVIEALNDPTKHVVVQTAPAVRASLGEEFGMPIGTRVTGKMVAALKLLGFDKVYDTNFGADLTIMEEGYEFIHRLQNGGQLPMITSCSPGWINYCEKEYPDLLDHLSSCKSPHMMLGAMIKSYYAKQHQLDPKNIYVVSIMPCVAKKGEKERSQMIKDGMKDVDAVLTTRELGKLIKMFGVNFVDLKDEEFDQDMFGEYTGAAVIFGASGGVMEAALRTVVDVLTNQDLDSIEYHAVRGQRGLKEATLQVGDLTVRVAVAHSMAIAKPLLDEIRAGRSPYHFIEVMGCPGGCINGGGQSYVSALIRNSGFDFKGARAKALYDEDRSMPARKSHKNTQIQKLYEDFLGQPNSHLAHELLHTTYDKQKKFK